MSRVCDSAGHTLVDVLLVLFLIGILLSSAAPDVARAHRRYTALTSARHLRSDLARARMDAILRGKTVTIAIDTLAGTWTGTDADGLAVLEGGVPSTIVVRTTAHRQSIPFTARGTTDLYSTTWIGPAGDPEGHWHGIRVAPSGALSAP